MTGIRASHGRGLLTWALLAGLLALAPRARAVVITTGCASASSCTLEELFNGATLTVDGTVFSNFTLTRNMPFPPIADPKVITVEGVDGAPNSVGPGLRYRGNGNLFFNEPQGSNPANLDLQFTFVVTSNSPYKVKDASLTTESQTVTGDSRIRLEETLFDFTGSVKGPQIVELINEVSTSPSNPIVMLADANEFGLTAGFFSSVQVDNVVNLGRLVGINSGSAQLDTFVQRFSLNPEPGTLSLMGFGLAAALLAVRRRASAG